MDKSTKQKIVQGAFFVEISTIFLLYLFGSQGLPVLWRIKKENLLISQEIDILQQEVTSLEKKCDQQEKYSFYKEKIARELLQMARDDDHIFYLSNNNKDRV